MAFLKSFGAVLSVLVLLFLFSCVFVVSEGENALLLYLGKLTTDNQGKAIVYKPGIHFKFPFINTVRKFDTRLQTMGASQYEVFTSEQKRLLVDYYVKWQISDLSAYYQRVGGYSSGAEGLLEKRLNNALRSAVGNIKLLDFIAGERVIVMDELRAAADSTAKDIGIKVIDVRIKQADLTPEVTRAVYERMRSDRLQAAEKYRAAGKASAIDIQARANADVQVAIADAQKQASVIRAEGSKNAAEIYGKAYQQDPEFYAFYRSLLAYSNTFQNPSDLLVLQPDGEFFKYFRQGIAKHGNSVIPPAKPGA